MKEVKLIKEGLEKKRIELSYTTLITILNSDGIEPNTMKELLKGISYCEKIKIAEELSESARERWLQIAISDSEYGDVIREGVKREAYAECSNISEKIEYLTLQVLETDIKFSVQELREMFESNKYYIQWKVIRKIEDFEFLQEIEKKLYKSEKVNLTLLNELYKNPLSKKIVLTDEQEAIIVALEMWGSAYGVRKKVIERTKSSEILINVLDIHSRGCAFMTEEEVDMIFDKDVIDEMEMQTFIEVFIKREKGAMQHRKESVWILKGLFKKKLAGRIEEDLLESIIKLLTFLET